MKKFIYIAFLGLAFLFLTMPVSQAKIKTYYSGDAAFYNGKLIIASADTDDLELFRAENGTINRLIKFKPIDRDNQPVSVSSVNLNEENGNLYAYVTSRYTVYKYNVSDPSYPTLTQEVKNTLWEWYNRLDVTSDRLITISNKNVKLLNLGLQNIDAYSLSTINAYNVRLDNTGQYILSNSGNYIQVYDRYTRTTTSNIPVSYNSGNQENNHKAYGDAASNEVFVVDDSFVKKFDLNGNLKASFRHLEQPGYDVEPSADGRFIYVSNGVGVLKLNRNDLKLNAYKFTYTIGGPAGWAMGLKAVSTPTGDNLVVFNNGNILVLNDKLNKVASYTAYEEDETPYTKESLFLNIDHNLGSVGSVVKLNGGGFYSKERLTIDFAGVQSQATTDDYGRFTQDLTIPDRPLGATDIKVTGQTSKYSYSLGFRIQ